jgi:hypothetical protein
MKIELTRAEIEVIVLNYINGLIPNKHFNHVEATGYRLMPDAFVVSTKEEENAAQ